MQIKELQINLNLFKIYRVDSVKNRGILTKMRKFDTDKRLRDTYKAIGNNIVRLRGKMSQEDLSKKAKVSRATISTIEQGRAISLENLIKIARALDVKTADLFITDENRGEVSYMHLMLLRKLSESLDIKPKK